MIATRLRSLPFALLLSMVPVQTSFVCNETLSSTFVDGKYDGSFNHQIEDTVDDHDCLMQAVAFLQEAGKDPSDWHASRCHDSTCFGYGSCELIQYPSGFDTSFTKWRACNIVSLRWNMFDQNITNCI